MPAKKVVVIRIQTRCRMRTEGLGSDTRPACRERAVDGPFTLHVDLPDGCRFRRACCLLSLLAPGRGNKSHSCQEEVGVLLVGRCRREDGSRVWGEGCREASRLTLAVRALTGAVAWTRAIFLRSKCLPSGWRCGDGGKLMRRQRCGKPASPL